MDARSYWNTFKGKTGQYWKHLPKQQREDLSAIEKDVIPFAAFPFEVAKAAATGDFGGAYRTAKAVPGHLNRSVDYLNKRTMSMRPYYSGFLQPGAGRRKSAPARLTKTQLAHAAVEAGRFWLSRKRKANTRPRGARPVKARRRVAPKKGVRWLQGRGTTGPKFRRPKKLKAPAAAKFGSIVEWDYGGQHATPGSQTLFIGHTTNTPNKVLQAVFMALIRKLYLKAGVPIKSFRDDVWNPFAADTSQHGNIYVEYKTHDQASGWVATTLNIVVSNDDTYLDLATRLFGAVRTVYTALDEEGQRTFELVDMFLSSGVVTTNNSFIEAKVELTGAKVNLMMSNRFKLQNISTAEQGVTGDHAHELVGHVEQNPMVGKCYETVGSNGFIPKIILDGSPLGVNVVTNNNTGLMEFESGDLGAKWQPDFNRPPSRFYFKNVKRMSPVGIGPGQIRQSSLSETKTIGLNALFKKYRGNMNSLNVQELSYLGRTRMYAFEKSMHTDSDNEPDMRVAWELHGYISCTISCHYQATAPSVLLESTTGTTDL